MCLTPITIKNKLEGGIMQVPCSKCPVCIHRRISNWSFRLMQQLKYSLNAQFITLTYNTKHIPITKRGSLDLKYRDLQLFFKRLRKLHIQHDNILGQPTYGYSIKYFAVGEYGTKSSRPHYHAILYNTDLELIQRAWSLENKPLGEVHYGEVNEASIGYTMKYLCKPSKIPINRYDDRTPQFKLQSTGLGKDYLTPNMIAWHLDDLENRMYCNLPGGIKTGMPRYYKQRIYTEEQRKIAGIAARERQLDETRLAIDKQGALLYYRNKAEAIDAAYRRMHYQSFQNQSL